MLIVELAPLSNGAHRNQSGPPVTPPKGWAVVPPELEAKCLSYLPFVNLEVGNGQIVGVSQGEIPPPEPEPEPPVDPMEQLRADVDFLLVMSPYYTEVRE